MLQLYVTVPPKVVLVGVPGDPSEIDGREPQEATIILRQRNIEPDSVHLLAHLHKLV